MKIWQRFWDKVRSCYKNIERILQAAVLYIAATALDDLTSLHFPEGFGESNPFARHMDGSFWLRHSLISEGLDTLEILLVSAGCYVVGRIFGRRLAQFVACLPWAYYAWLHADAAFFNLKIEVGLYQQTVHDVLKGLLGQ